MINIIEQKKELRSFDSKLVDPNGSELSIDCQMLLPNIWGEKVDITLAIPNSEMPIKSFDNPSQLKTTCDYSETRVKMKDVRYRSLTTNIVPSRKTGQTSISVDHIDSLYLIEKFTSDENKFYIYISSSDFFDQCMRNYDGMQVDEFAKFNCPKLGYIKLQRYGVKASVNNSSQMLQSFGYQLEVDFSENVSTTEYILKHISPTLDLMSVLLRQRITVYGWQSFKDNLHTRFWKYPLDKTETNYIGVEPKNYLVSFKKFQEQVNAGIKNYQSLEQQSKDALFQLSYALSPAIDLKDEERFMSLFKRLESIANKLSGCKESTPEDKLLIESLREVSESFKQTNPKIYERVNGFIIMVSKNDLSLRDKLKLLLKNKNVFCADLWPVESDKGLTRIRNTLAHQGAVGVNHHGLAVSTLHLSLLVERLVFNILSLTMESDIATQIKRDEWLSSSYFNALKTNIFRV
jgi:hypothetical protein